MSVSESVFVALLTLSIVFLVLFVLYGCIRLFSLALARTMRATHATTQPKDKPSA